MHIIRPIEEKDIEAFVKMAFEAGIGMTSLPKNRTVLLKRIEASVRSFANTPSHPGDEFYLFVLEDQKSGTIGGTSGIIAKTGMNNPLSFFRIMHNEVHKGIDGKDKIAPLLRVVHYINYWSEICSLYLSKSFRHSGLGRLLSLSRFLFIASHPERFDKIIFAEMRGHIDEQRNSPFWEGIGRHFIDTTFESLMHLRDESSVDLREVLPAHPIYIELLPKEVQQVVGKLHDETVPAFKLLTEEGFALTDEIDICDGGPKIAAEVKHIKTILASMTAQVGNIADPMPDSPLFLVSTTGGKFKACLAPLAVDADGSVTLPSAVAEALNLHHGSIIRFAPLHHHEEHHQGHYP